MKRKLVVYLAGLLTVLSVGFGSAQFSDVPAGHWAKEAVDKIAACGLITGFPDGTYRGNQNLTRYQAALIFQRLLDELNNGGQCVKKDGSGMSADDLTAIRNAVQELASELAALGVRVSALEDNAASKDDIAALQAAMDEMKAAQDAMMSAEPADMSNMATQDDVAALQASIDDLQAQMDAMQADKDAMMAAMQADKDAMMAAMQADNDAMMDAMQADKDAMMADNDAAMAAMQADIDAMAAEPAAEPVDTSNMATQDDVANLQASIDALQAQIDAMQADKDAMMAQAQADKDAMMAQAGMDAQALQDLSDRVEAASVAADTALAQSEQLASRLDDAEGRLDAADGGMAALQTQVDADGDSIRALNELAVLLNQDVLSLQDRTSALEQTLAGVDFESFASKEDVAAIQEFATALRSDLVKLSDRVGVVEGRVTDLAGRVGTLERNGFTISGSLTLTYLVKRAWGAGGTFDIDRIIPGTTFGSKDGDGNVTFGTADLGQKVEGDTTAALSVTFQTGKFDGTSSPGKFNSYPAFTQFSITGNWSGTVGVAGTNPAADVSVPAGLEVDAISTTLLVAGGQPLNFSFGQKPKTKFTEYVFDNDNSSRGPGFRAQLPFPILGGQTWVVYGSKGGANGDNTYFRGVRAAFGLGPINLGASFVQEGVDQVPGNGGAPAPITVGGVDVSAALGPINLKGEFLSTDAATTGNTGFYIMADASLGFITLNGNFRNLGANVTPANLLSADADNGVKKWGGDNNDAPFSHDSNGFGVGAKLALGPLALRGNFDSYTRVATAVSGFGVGVSTTLGPIGLDAWFRSLTVGGAATDAVGDATKPGGDYVSGSGDALETSLGVKATIKGLIPNLNLTASFESRSVVPNTKIAVYGDFTLNAGAISAKLIGRFATNSNPSSTTIKYGAQITTQPLFLGIGLEANGASRTTSGTNTTEGVGYIGITAANLLVSNSSLRVGYGGYGGQNLASIDVGAGTDNKAFDPSEDKLYVGAGAKSGTVVGIFWAWSYWDLTFSYADFDLVDNGAKTHGQAFKIAYKVTF